MLKTNRKYFKWDWVKYLFVNVKLHLCLSALFKQDSAQLGYQTLEHPQGI